MRPDILLAILLAAQEAMQAGEEVKVEHADPDEILLLGTHPNGKAIGVCAPCSKSILNTMEEANRLYWQSKDDKLERFSALGKCDSREDRFHMVLRTK